MSEKKYVIIAAAGYGARMQSDIPKQFMLLAGIPVIARTILSFAVVWPDAEFIVVLPGDELMRWEKIRKKFLKKNKIQSVSGGATRFHSVKNGLKQVKENGIVAVQDACRPFVNEELLLKCLETVTEKGNAIPVVDIKDSLREILKDGSRHRNRMRFKAVQTPQCFEAAQLKNAYRQTFSESFTDDASVVESAGVKINLVNGDPGNFKITTPYDLLLAEKILMNGR
ncbi:MAG TPA: 2-C-methyl-D-erythritol 4-phosphate cytidylyltransferase [Chitinophagales bacterium]|nr:2-C-methyl-D-erythritol 4-phosphate cytidylyltransferase [Chitinophagales bacterium]